MGPDETEVRVRIEYEPESAVESIGSALHAADKRVKDDLKRFKEFIESRGVETGSWRGEVRGGETRPRGSH
jgi:uncharacterized membrane protein